MRACAAQAPSDQASCSSRCSSSLTQTPRRKHARHVAAHAFGAQPGGGARPGSGPLRGGPLKCPKLLHVLPQMEPSSAARPVVAHDDEDGDDDDVERGAHTFVLGPEAAAYLMERLNLSGDALPKLFATAGAPLAQRQAGTAGPTARLDVWERNVDVLERAIGGERTHERVGKMILDNPALLNAEQLHTWHEFLVPGMGCPADLFVRTLANYPEVRAAHRTQRATPRAGDAAWAHRQPSCRPAKRMQDTAVQHARCNRNTPCPQALNPPHLNAAARPIMIMIPRRCWMRPSTTPASASSSSSPWAGGSTTSSSASSTTIRSCWRCRCSRPLPDDTHSAHNTEGAGVRHPPVEATLHSICAAASCEPEALPFACGAPHHPRSGRSPPPFRSCDLPTWASPVSLPP